MSDDWVMVDEVSGDVIAEIMRGMLEAQGIDVWLSQEGAGKAYGISISGLGMVHVMVPASQEESARAILEAYYQGTLEANPVPEDSGSEFKEDDLALSEEILDESTDEEEAG